MAVTNDQRAAKVYDFGPFRLDADREMLLRDGEPVALTRKTFQILLVLVQRGNELVSKDELMAAVWPDTFVEEGNLTRHVFMLRKALGESPQDHRYVLTVPGQGYRLAESVQVVGDTGISLVSSTTSKVQVEVRESRFRPWVAAVLACAFAVVLAGVYFLARPARVLGSQDTVLLGDFTNTTGDSVFDGTLRQGLAVQLEQSPFLSLVSDNRVQQTLQRMGRPAGTRLAGDVGRDVCQRTGAAAVLEGSIAPLGTEYVLSLRATRCSTGDILDQEQVQATKKEALLNALSGMAVRFRSRVGESLAQVKEHAKPLPEATTSSLEALKAFSEGYRLVSTSPTESIAFLRRAVELDPNFALAYGLLSRQYGDVNEFALSREAATRAYELRDRATDPERFWITANYNTQVREDMEQAREVCEVWAKTYPRDPIPLDMMAGIIDPVFGRYDSAIDEAKQALARDPSFGVSYPILAARYRNAGRLDDASQTLKLSFERSAVRPETLLERYDIAFLKNDDAGMEYAVRSAAEDAAAQEWIAEHEAQVLAWQGRWREARLKFAEAERLADAGGRHESAALYAAAEAVAEAWFGNQAEAKAAAGKALGIGNGDAGVAYGAALALALSGDAARAATIAADLEKNHAEDTSVRFSYLPVVQAVLALEHKRPEQAMDALQVAQPYDLGTPRTAIHANFGALYAPYARGLAYVAAGKPGQAAAEFEKLVQHPGIVVNDPVGILAQLQFARAEAAAGDKARARTAYQAVLAAWEDADPRLALVKQARLEYADLSRP